MIYKENIGSMNINFGHSFYRNLGRRPSFGYAAYDIKHEYVPGPKIKKQFFSEMNNQSSKN